MYIHYSSTIISSFYKISSLLFQVAERRPFLFLCPSFTTGAPREFSQRDPRDMLLPGGGNVSQPRLSDQLSLRSPRLYEENLVQHWNHVSKRNKFVGLRTQTRICRCSLCQRLDLNPCTCRKPNTRILGYANAFITFKTVE